MGLFDIGANLTHESFSSDIQELLQSAYQAQVHNISVTACTLEDSRKAVQLIEQLQEPSNTEEVPTYPALITTVGFHPHYASQYTKSCYSEMLEHSRNSLVKAVGETGLDYYRHHSSKQEQKASFEEHMRLAAETQLPLFLHQRDAHTDFAEMLSSNRDSFSQVVVHCFTGEKAMLYQYLDLDCFIGITGWICDSKRGRHLWPLMADIPVDKLMIETDSPYLLPPSYKKELARRNEPRCLYTVLETIAGHRQETTEQLAEYTSKNALAFFDVYSASNR